MKLNNEVKRRLKNSLVAFRDVVLANDSATEKEPAEFHYRLSDLLLNEAGHVAIEMFRESGKSSYVLRAFPLHCLAYPSKQRDYIVIIKQNQTLASAKLKDMVNEYLANPLVRHNLREIKENSGKAFSADVYDESGKIINVRFEAYGKGAAIRGLNSMDRRPTVVILDDIQDKDDARSETVTLADWEWFLSDVVFLGERTRIFFIGNNLGEKCCLEKCINNAESLHFKVIRVPIMIDDKPAWPAKHTIKGILEEREDYAKMGKTDIWFAEKMCQAVSDESRIFKEEDYRYYSPLNREDLIGRCNLFACLDPASSTNPESCYRAITLTGVDASSAWFLLDVKYGRWDSAEMVNIIFDMVVKYRLRDFYIEKGWWVQVMEPFLTAEMKKRNIFFNVVPLEHARQGSKLERIKMLQPRFKAHTVYFPDDAQWLGEMKTEMAGVTKDAIKSEYIDCVDALAMTEQVAVAPVNTKRGYFDNQRSGNQYQAQSLFEIAGY